MRLLCVLRAENGDSLQVSAETRARRTLDGDLRSFVGLPPQPQLTDCSKRMEHLSYYFLTA